MTSSKSAQRLAVTLILFVTLTGCDDTAPQPIELPPPEIFSWTTGQPISFSPPPVSWNRSRYQNGGAEGADFVLAGSNGEQVYVAERFFLGNRDRCGKMHEILDNLDHYDQAGFRRIMGTARLAEREGAGAREARTVKTVNYTLERATEAFLRQDTATARVELQRALDQAAAIRFTVEDSVDRVLFIREGNSVYPALQVDEPVPGELADESALVVHFTFNGPETPMIGRRVYAVKNNRMFEFGFQGLEEHLEQFELILDSVTFPPGTCEH